MALSIMYCALLCTTHCVLHCVLQLVFALGIAQGICIVYYIVRLTIFVYHTVVYCVIPREAR